MSWRLALLAAAVVGALALGWVSVERTRGQLAALEICEAAQRGDWAAAFVPPAPAGAGESARAAAECRCLAQLASERGEACVARLEEILSDPEADGWAPREELSVHLIQTWREAGRRLEAAELARRAAAAHPHSPPLFYLELLTRSGVEDEERVLAELAERVAGGGPGSGRMRLSLAERHLLRGDPESALAILEAAPAPEDRDRWFEARARAHAANDDLASVARTFEAWSRAGAERDPLVARYALTLSLAGLKDPQRSPVELLRAGLAAAERVGDDGLREALAIRLILTLVNRGTPQEAIAVYDRYRDELALEGLSRDELLRSASHGALAGAAPAQRRGELRFRVNAPEPGDELWLAPGPGSASDAPYERQPVPASGDVAAPRPLGLHPPRWVLRDAEGRLRASGTANPRPGAPVQVEVERRPPLPPAAFTPTRRPADGRRRVLLLLPDCQDWRIVQYLRMRGELPVLDALLTSGYRAVLRSDPPLTAAALESLVWPGRHSGASFVGLLHQLGVELAGLSSIGDNPFAALSWLLPEEEDLFAVIGAGERSAANLLLAHGGIRAGRHGEVTGPRGERRLAPIGRSARDLDAAERERFPGLAGELAERDALHLRTIAAELDVAEQLAGATEPDLLMLRIEPLDILTHAHFAEAVQDGQDDGAGLLFSVYRYLDWRLGHIHDRLDADDVLIVMSDHGIRTAMEHSLDALFVAVGEGVPRGRAEGMPELRGVPAVLADLLGVSHDWPRTGVAPWSASLPGADERTILGRSSQP